MTKNEIINEINQNNVVILPTDTVYGIMAKFNKQNEIKINKIKKSDIDKKISVIFGDMESLLKNIDNLDGEKLDLIKTNLPGKYTFIVNLKKTFCVKNGFNRTDFGVRVTSNTILQNIIKKTYPLLASSCNITNHEVCLIKKDIINTFDLPYLFTENGNKSASTIIDLTKKEIKVIRM